MYQYLYFLVYIYLYVFIIILYYYNISSTVYHKFALKHHIFIHISYFNILEYIRIIFEYFLNLLTIYPLKVTLLKIRLRLVSIDLIYFDSSYSLEVKHSIQGESTFLDTCLSFVKIKLILYFYTTLYTNPAR